MAKCIGSFAKTLSGKLGGMIFAEGPGGTTIRPHSYVRQPKTNDQQSNRHQFRAINHRYTGLTDDQIEGWNDLAARMTRTDSLGQRHTLSGQQAHASVNTLRRALGLPFADTAPACPDIPAPLTNVFLTAFAPAPHCPLGRVAVHADPVPEGIQVQVHACDHFSPSRTFVGDSKYRVLGVLDAVDPSGTDITALYLSKFGILPLGRKVSVRLVPLSASGFAGPESRAATRIE